MACNRIVFILHVAMVIVVAKGRKVPDWLIHNITKESVLENTHYGNLRLNNGLIFREFTLKPDFATIDYYSYEKQSSLLRAISPEAVISLDGIVYNVGGLNTSIPRGYLNRSALAEDMNLFNNAFHYVSHKIKRPEAPFPYSPKRGAPKNIEWPPKGLRLDVFFAAPDWSPDYHKDISVIVHFEIYDGVPILNKWLTIATRNSGKGKVKVGVLSVENLAVNWQWADDGYKWLYAQTDRPHGTEVKWSIDSKSNQMPGSFQRNLNFTYSPIPFLYIEDNFQSFKAMEILIGSADQERVGLAKRRMMRLLAPHTQENPIFVHIIHSDSKSMRFLVDQIAEVGFEMLFYSFGSQFTWESSNKSYLAHLANDVAYAKSKGIEVGGYDLIALTRKVKPEWSAKHGLKRHDACFASGWYDFLLERILNTMSVTGMTYIGTDGPYGGYSCSSTNHSHHQNYQDSVYQQDKYQGKFYTILRTKGVYIMQPDAYFYQGGNKAAMGYNEHQYSLPRWQDLSISRQGMFDDTFHYIPSVGWMFLPITVYHGGGDAAKFVPLEDHIEEYNWALAQYLGAGVAATYRGDRLFDGPKSKALVKKWVTFYKKYRDILTSDIIHVRRADMQSIDCFMHVNPFLTKKALAMVFNPTNSYQSVDLSMPLYYAGITTSALVSQEEAPFVQYTLDREYNIDIIVKLPPLGVTWYIICES